MILHLVARWRRFRCRWTSCDWTGWAGYSQPRHDLGAVEYGQERFCERCWDSQFRNVFWMELVPTRKKSPWEES